MTGKTVDVQAEPDPMPVAGQRPGPPFFSILIVAGLIVICAGLRSAASIVAPVFLVITLVITVAPLRRSAGVSRPSWLASAITLLAIYNLLIPILGSVVRLTSSPTKDRPRKILRSRQRPQTRPSLARPGPHRFGGSSVLGL